MPEMLTQSLFKGETEILVYFVKRNELHNMHSINNNEEDISDFLEKFYSCLHFWVK